VILCRSYDLPGGAGDVPNSYREHRHYATGPALHPRDVSLFKTSFVFLYFDNLCGGECSLSFVGFLVAFARNYDPAGFPANC